jgi:hypothetical protein
MDVEDLDVETTARYVLQVGRRLSLTPETTPYPQPFAYDNAERASP